MGGREVDSAARAQRIEAFGWGLFAGLPGALLGWALLRGALGGWGGAAVGFVLGILVAGAGALLLAGAGGRAGRSLHMPSGATTPGSRQYSLADALAARGRPREAAAELERCAERWPADVEPKLRLARLLRDALASPEPASTWFRRALETPQLPAAVEQMVLRELIELHVHRLGQPRAAAPWLARLAQRHAGSPAAAWAARELAALKQEMRHDEW